MLVYLIEKRVRGIVCGKTQPWAVDDASPVFTDESMAKRQVWEWNNDYPKWEHRHVPYCSMLGPKQ